MNYLQTIGLLAVAALLAGCGMGGDHAHPEDGHEPHTEEAVTKGPHGGRMLVDDNFALELAIVEAGVPPEFRVWITDGGEPVAPDAVDLEITLDRLGGVTDAIAFRPQEDFLRGDTVIYEPHSFVVTVEARHKGAVHRWEYDNFEGRTRIGDEVAKTFGLSTETAGPATIRETVDVFGRVRANSERVRQVGARFSGTIQSVAVSKGDRVSKGQVLAKVESNESLAVYDIVSPIDGVITERVAQPGEQTGEESLFSVMDNSSVWVELDVFPRNLPDVRRGASVTITGPDGQFERVGTIDFIAATAGPDQSVLARATLDNPEGQLVPGMFVEARIQIVEHEVPLAVKRTGLQGFRDFTVVYAKFGDQYEVRMLDLGREDHEWVEVLGGLEPGTRYVTSNSYLVKADIEKSGASHDH